MKFRQLSFFKSRSALSLFGVVALSAHLGCTEPQKIDPSVTRGYELLSTDPKAALAELEKAKSEKDHRIPYARGLAHEALGDFKAAKAQYEAVLSLRKRHTLAETARARVEILLGEVDQGHAHLAQVVEKAPHALPALLLYAVSARSKEEHAKAAKALANWSGRADGDAQKAPPAEYLLVRSELLRLLGEEDRALENHKLGSAALVESQRAALSLAQFADSLEKPRLSRDLLSRLARTQLSPELAREVVSLSVRLGHLPAAELSAKQVPVYPEDAENLLALGRYHVAAKHHASAIETLTQSLKLLNKGRVNERSEAQFLLGQALLNDERPKDALITFGALPQGDQARLSTQLLMGQAELALGKSEQAIKRLSALTQQHPGSVEAKQKLAGAYISAERFSDAAKVVDAMLVESPKDQAAILLLVDLLVRQRNWEEAEKRLLSALDVAPKSDGFVSKLVDVYLVQKKADQAIAFLSARIAARPQDEQSALLLAATYERLGKKDELEKTLTELTSRLPNSDKAWLSLSRVAETLGDRPAVEKSLLRVIEIQPENREAIHHLAAHYTLVNQPKKAAQQYERLLELNPKDAISMNNLALLLVEQLADAEKGVALAEKASEISPVPALQDTLAWALLVRGRPKDVERAVILLKRASKRLRDPDSRLHYAVALHLSGKKAEAATLLQGFVFKEEVVGHQVAQRLLGQSD